jgi:hypothetical protein
MLEMNASIPGGCRTGSSLMVTWKVRCFCWKKLCRPVVFSVMSASGRMSSVSGPWTLRVVHIRIIVGDLWRLHVGLHLHISVGIMCTLHVRVHLHIVVGVQWRLCWCTSPHQCRCYLNNACRCASPRQCKWSVDNGCQFLAPWLCL